MTRWLLTHNDTISKLKSIDNYKLNHIILIIRHMLNGFTRNNL